MDIYKSEDMSIITKTGDKGQTKLISPTKGQHRMVDKDSQIVWAIGTIDELNSFLGIIKVAASEPEVVEELQTQLFTISSILAGGKVEFDKSAITEIEKAVESAEKLLPEISNFVYSGGSELSAAFHFARSLARRAEREVVALSKLDTVDPDITVFLNRLSDFLFIMMRLELYRAHAPEKVWKPIRKFTDLPEVVSLGDVEGYRQEDLVKWFKDNDVDPDDFFRPGVRVALNKGQIIVLRPDVEEMIAKLK